MAELSSPTPNQVKIEEQNPIPMTFPDAMRKVIEGKKVHKLEWKDKNYYAFLNGQFLSIHKSDGVNYKWIVSDGDLNGDDYVVV